MSKGTNQLSAKPEAVAIPRGGLHSMFVGLLLGVAVLAIYWPVLSCDFILYDDPTYYASNPHVLGGMTWENLAWAFRTTENSSWYPLTWLSYLLDAQLFGGGPAGPHLTNLLLHAANGVLLFLLLSRLTGAHGRSAMVAGLFALHPLRVETVAWISERKGVLSLFFGLLSLWFYARYALSETRNPRPSRKAGRDPKLDYSLSLFFFACGLLSKPMLVALPLVMLLLDYWPLERVSSRFAGGFRNSESRRAVAPSQRVGLWTSDFLPRRNEVKAGGLWTSVSRRLVREKLPFFLAAIVFSVVTFQVHKQRGMLASLGKFSIGDRMENALVSYARYLGKTFWPVNLALPYPHPGSWPLWGAAAAAALVAGLSVAAVWQARRRPFFFVGWFWFWGTLFPVIGVVQWSEQAMADRFTYLPSIGLFILVIWGVSELCLKWRLSRMIMGAGAGAVLVAYSVRTGDQLLCWCNSEALFRHAVAVTEKNELAYGILGTYLAARGQPEEAMANLQKARQINPNNPRVINEIGWVLANQKQYAEATEFFEAAVRLEPKWLQARTNLAAVLLVQGKCDDALAQYTEAVQLAPGNASLQDSLGTSLRLGGKLDEALVHFREAVRLDPKHLKARRNLAAILTAQNQYEEAIGQYREVLRLAPNDRLAEYHLAVLFDRTGKFDEAIEHGRRAVDVLPDYAEAHQQLGELLARAGDKANAVVQWREAMRLKPDWVPALNRLAWLLATDQDAAWRDGKEAVMLGERAARATTNGSPEVLDTLAAAYAESGRWGEAVGAAQRAIELAVALGREKLAGEIRGRMEQYQAGRPWRE